jgi:hypothetical protein
MLELTVMGSVLRGIGLLYWAFAIGAVVLAIRYGKGTRGKVIWAAVAIAAFGYLPGRALIEQHQRDAYAKEAWAYFKKLCDEKSGEKIYKTYTGVKSVLVVKALPPATEKDLYDQFWYGDPYSNATPWDKRAELAASTLADPVAPISLDKMGRGYDFVESSLPSDKGRIVKYFYPENARKSVDEIVSAPVSRYGISWEDISSPEDRKYWVAGSRLRVIDLTDNSVAAERVGYFIEAGFGSTAGQRRPWLTSRGPSTTCPAIRDGHFDDRWFILKVLNPIEGKQDGK